MRKRYGYGEQGEPRQEQDAEGVEAESAENPDHGRQDQDHDQNLHTLSAHRQGCKGRLANLVLNIEGLLGGHAFQHRTVELLGKTLFAFQVQQVP